MGLKLWPASERVLSTCVSAIGVTNLLLMRQRFQSKVVAGQGPFAVAFG